MNAMNENQQPDEDENKQTQDEGSDDSFLDSLEEDGDEDTSDYDVEIDDLDDLTIEERSENILEEVNNIYNDESETASNKLAILQEIASSLEETIMNLEEEIDDDDGDDDSDDDDSDDDGDDDDDLDDDLDDQESDGDESDD
jgi:ribonuclease E